MSIKELERYKVIQRLIDGLIKVEDAAFGIRLSGRPVMPLVLLFAVHGMMRSLRVKNVS